MDIYENIFIGNFIYSLGVRIGASKRAVDLPLAVNLLQQTPLDQSAGDVLLRGSRVMRLLEFKRATNDGVKEERKLEHLRRALSHYNHDEMTTVSNECHWYIETDYRHSSPSIKIVPYLNQLEKYPEQASLHSFVDSIVTEATSPGPDRSKTYSSYLHLVSLCQGDESGASGGLIVSVDESGKLSYVFVDNLREIGMELKMLQEIYRTRTASREQEYERVRSPSFSPQRDVRGPSL